MHPATMNATCTDIPMSLVLYNSFLEDVSKTASFFPQPLQLYFMETAPPSSKVLNLTGVSSLLHPCVAHICMLFSCFMNLSSWVKSIKQTFCGMTTSKWWGLHRGNRIIIRFNQKRFITGVLVELLYFPKCKTDELFSQSSLWHNSIHDK